MPLTPIVANMVLSISHGLTSKIWLMTHAIPMPLRSTTSSSPFLVARCRDSMNTWTKEAIIATEKMSYQSAPVAIGYSVVIHLQHQGAQIGVYQLDTDISLYQ